MKLEIIHSVLIGILVYLILILIFRTREKHNIITHPTEYHFNVDETGYDIFTEDMKPVGRLNYGDNPTLDSLIDSDNQ